MPSSPFAGISFCNLACLFTFRYTAEYFLKKDHTEGDNKRERKQRTKVAKPQPGEGAGDDEEDDGFQVVGKRNKLKKDKVRTQKKPGRAFLFLFF
jgi:hypothetical protein